MSNPNCREDLALAREIWSAQRAARIEDYQYIRGDRMPARAAAERLGVSKRTIHRYRRQLREQTT